MKYTFGKTVAAQRFEYLLDSNPIARRKVSRIISKYTSQMLRIVSLKDPETVRLCLDLLREYTLNRIDKMKSIHYNDDIKSYAKNVIIARYRDVRHGFDGLVPEMENLNRRIELTFGKRKV